MKEIKLTIDGKEIKLTAEQIKALGIDIDDDCICDRSEINRPYFRVNSFYSVSEDKEVYCDLDNEYYNVGNYYRDKAYAEQVALHQHLNNLLRRYSEQNGGDAEWDCYKLHYIICYSHRYHTLNVEKFCMSKFINCVYFSTEKVAEKAIEEVVKPFMYEHPDFVW